MSVGIFPSTCKLQSKTIKNQNFHKRQFYLVVQQGTWWSSTTEFVTGTTSVVVIHKSSHNQKQSNWYHEPSKWTPCFEVGESVSRRWCVEPLSRLDNGSVGWSTIGKRDLVFRRGLRWLFLRIGHSIICVVGHIVLKIVTTSLVFRNVLLKIFRGRHS